MAALIFLFSVTYHVISKLRGNEKNPQMNNFGIGLAVLGVVYMTINFIDDASYFYLNEEYVKWYYNH